MRSQDVNKLKIGQTDGIKHNHRNLQLEVWSSGHYIVFHLPRQPDTSQRLL